MDNIEIRLYKTHKKRKLLTSLFVGFILLGMILYLIKLPVHMAGWFVPFKVEIPTYIPIDIESEYAKAVGFDRVKVIYKNPEESMTVWATTKIGWNNVSSWDESITLIDGTPAYYNESEGMQMISWRLDKVEYSIDFKGQEPLSKGDLIKVASSIK